MIKQVAAFKDSKGEIHTSRLKALLSEKEIETRGILQTGAQQIGIKLNGTVAVSDVIKIISGNIPALSKISRRFDKMIRNEQSKGSSVVVS